MKQVDTSEDATVRGSEEGSREGDVLDIPAAKFELPRQEIDASNRVSGRRSIDTPQAGLDEEAIREAAIAEARADAVREAREAVAADRACTGRGRSDARAAIAVLPRG